GVEIAPAPLSLGDRPRSSCHDGSPLPGLLVRRPDEGARVLFLIAEVALDALLLRTALRHVGEVAFAGCLLPVVPHAERLEVLEPVVVSALDVVHVGAGVEAATSRGLSATAVAVTLEHLLAATLPVGRQALLSI